MSHTQSSGTTVVGQTTTDGRLACFPLPGGTTIPHGERRQGGIGCGVALADWCSLSRSMLSESSCCLRHAVWDVSGASAKVRSRYQALMYCAPPTMNKAHHLQRRHVLSSRFVSTSSDVQLNKHMLLSVPYNIVYNFDSYIPKP